MLPDGLQAPRVEEAEEVEDREGHALVHVRGDRLYGGGNRDSLEDLGWLDLWNGNRWGVVGAGRWSVHVARVRVRGTGVVADDLFNMRFWLGWSCRCLSVVWKLEWHAEAVPIRHGLLIVRDVLLVQAGQVRARADHVETVVRVLLNRVVREPEDLEVRKPAQVHHLAEVGNLVFAQIQLF